MRRRRTSGYVAHSGTTISAANFVQPANDANAPRSPGDAAKKNPRIRNAGRIESFVFELDVYCVNGYAAHANGSVAASRWPPKRQPTSASPSMHSASKAIDVKCAAGSESHFPLQPKSRKPGMYDSYDAGPYVSPRSFEDSQRPFVWIRSRISPSRSAGPHGSRSSCTGKFPYGASPLTMRCAPITPAYPTSITFEVSTFTPSLKRARNTAAATSTQTGHTGRDAVV